MTQNFDVIVVGKGMMGAAAARHLALAGVKTLLIGPPEPGDFASHTGVFASHYDQGRITRQLDRDPVWARLASQSIARYGEIADQGEAEFFYQTGGLIAGNSDYIASVAQIGRDQAVPFETLDGQDLGARFPFFGFPDGTFGLFEPESGYINPRTLVAAQTRAAIKAGATLVEEEVATISTGADGVSASTVAGNIFQADQIILATGAFTQGVLASALPLNINPRTVVMAELDAQGLSDLGAMPTLIFEDETGRSEPYILPPIPYPDGKTYVKIGGDITSAYLAGPEAAKTWFHGTGSEDGRTALMTALFELMPHLTPVSTHTAPCVTALTDSGRPLVRFVENRVIALTGGNGAGAKSSDEIGRLGAVLAQTGTLANEPYGDVF